MFSGFALLRERVDFDTRLGVGRHLGDDATLVVFDAIQTRDLFT